jgi:hypothetical protein
LKAAKAKANEAITTWPGAQGRPACSISFCSPWSASSAASMRAKMPFCRSLSGKNSGVLCAVAVAAGALPTSRSRIFAVSRSSSLRVATR